ncbi:hypothetical protein RHGRI_024676 [Rhododendron griersonianum]|uniref:Uncharacterized protein n=2 Tax=Rhododendron griersonianum TaxID=479676 RepID=A0AAV6JD70_9ERIC|nr:hypothetical protein RHGRI_024676 [Rhododendron griersonianum]
MTNQVAAPIPQPKWKAPAQGKVKINCDAWWKKELGQGFAAVIIRNHTETNSDLRSFLFCRFLTDSYLGHPTFEISLSLHLGDGSKDSVGVDVAVLGHSCDRCVGFPEICNLGARASRLLANLIVMGGGIMARAVVQAYRQALMNASKNGVAQEAAQNIIRATKIMAEPEARQILGVTERSSWEEILQKYDHLFEKNAKNGSFYLQSKVHRAKECLEMEYRRAAERATGS